MVGSSFGGTAASPVDVCGACGRNKICKTHKAEDRAEIKRLKGALEDEDPEVRMEALEEVAELASNHENAPGKAAAEVLVAALEDDQLVVQAEAFRLLADGQHPEVAVGAYVARLKWFQSHMWSLVGDMTGPGEKHGSAAEAMEVLDAAVRGCKELPDDRIVSALAGLLKSFPNEMRGEPVAMSASRALLRLGTQGAVQAVISQFNAHKDLGKLRQVHMALKTFAFGMELDGTPEFDDDVEAGWTQWLRKHKRRIPKKLGKWKGPEPEPEEDEDDDDRD